MTLTSSKVTLFTFFKLPVAFWSGVRVNVLNEKECLVKVTHNWFTQNPFKSMYFAVQAMAAELSTGALVMYHVKSRAGNISMLVAKNNAVFTKKATGKIRFTCCQGQLVAEAIDKALTSKEGQTIWLKSIGINEQGEQVSEMQFEWTIKVRG